jgi:hypothetical protein
MSAISQIEHAVSQLPPRELARFREWFEKFDAKIWDKQFEQDAKSGKLGKRANQAIADFRAGKYKELWSTLPRPHFGNCMTTCPHQFKSWQTKITSCLKRIRAILRYD